MNARKVVALVAMVLSVFTFAVSAAGKPNDNIIIGNADTVRETPVSVEQGLLNAIVGAGVRVVTEYANTLRRMELPALPGALQTQLDQVSARVVVDHVNTIRRSDLPALPAGLQTLLGQVSERVVVDKANTTRRGDLPPLPAAIQTLLGQVSDRIVFQYANTDRQMGLGYPVTLINDTAPPQISGVTARITRGGVTITWTIDEYATSILRYGMQPGLYPQTVSDSLYAKQHEITLAGLTPGVTYYFVVRGADRSGNTAESAESRFTTTIPTYLPAILQRR